MNSVYSNLGAIKTGYKEQLIYYYNKGVGKISEIANVVITKTLISTVEKRYKQLGGRLPIPSDEILRKKGLDWKELYSFKLEEEKV
jgi:hypothetical protein